MEGGATLPHPVHGTSQVPWASQLTLEGKSSRQATWVLCFKSNPRGFPFLSLHLHVCSLLAWKSSLPKTLLGAKGQGKPGTCGTQPGNSPGRLHLEVEGAVKSDPEVQAHQEMYTRRTGAPGNGLLLKFAGAARNDSVPSRACAPGTLPASPGDMPGLSF